MEGGGGEGKAKENIHVCKSLTCNIRVVMDILGHFSVLYARIFQVKIVDR